jgi:acyl-CoA thioester hydrolase
MFKFERIINYYETDKMGIVHHSNYIRFLEEARCKWLESVDLTMAKIEAAGLRIPTIEVNCKYKTGVTNDDKIIINLMVEEFNGVRMKVKYTIVNAANDALVMEAYTQHCFTNVEGRPINLKRHNEEMYEKISSLVE